MKYFGMQVRLENTSEGQIEIQGLQERRKGAPAYNLILEKSKICFLTGENNVEKTRLMEMIAGARLSTKESSMVVRDGDFFVRNGKPDISDFIVYCSSDVILED